MKRLLTLLLVVAFGIPMNAQEIGLQLYSLRNQLKSDVPGTLQLINDWGIRYIEGGDTYGLPMVEFQALLTKNNLDVVSVGAGYDDLKNGEIDKIIANAKAFGAKYVMCAWISHEGNNFDIAKTKEATRVFNAAGKKLKEAGITLAYHAHGYEFRPYKEGTLFDYMAQNAEHFDFEMDVYWVQHGGADPLSLLNTYPDKFVLLHLKDMEKGTPKDDTGHADVETNVVLGTGEVDIAGVVKRAKELGVVEYMFIEDECSKVVEQVPQSLQYLKSLE
ncbi:TIM barrel protein [Aggregatimonas sangjinii]|uniref:TIM barrel protein n=1 Tax=Aggregatimonas sangjinii TaxID=2583587 RepID=A0A5B7SM24_9FLAO|nr:TIM barrel protein [Aggregatimonas sangjinii]QCW99516.1 TIM barrel protein [Aggregatimonas sangjinii]